MAGRSGRRGQVNGFVVDGRLARVGFGAIVDAVPLTRARSAQLPTTPFALLPLQSLTARHVQQSIAIFPSYVSSTAALLLFSRDSLVSANSGA